jgi:hypothetical protein
MVNAFVGKSMKNVIKRPKIELISHPAKLKNILAKSQLQQFMIVDGEKVLFNRIRAKVTLNKPMYVGFTVLDV